MVTKTVVHRDVWGHEREGYTDKRRVAYAPVESVSAPSATSGLRFEEQLGLLCASGGIMWGVQVFTSHLPNLNALWETRGPLEVCAIGALIWVHAKWRRSVRLH
ncbi:MAG: hypothetical protein LAN37_10095 [Acidobacteriia bacterium]|nr:hypothetical protein [Terriglobia bacterium]